MPSGPSATLHCTGPAKLVILSSLPFFFHASHLHIAPGADSQALAPPGIVRKMIHRLHAQSVRVGRIGRERALGRVHALRCAIRQSFRKLAGIEQGNARRSVLWSIVNIHFFRV
jgi:hypothetical protein